MIIKIKVKLKSKENRIELLGDKYVAYVRERAEDGKANAKLINLLAKKFKVHYSMIKIKNPKSRNKIVEIKNEI